ncbi:MAG: flagellar export protein FliJ [Pirellulales bacterium]|nr:flagellar export protein FliJ [Pirellulales bacterium]
MGKFRFRLATLLRLLENARQERRAELAQAYEADDVLRGQLNDVHENQRQLLDACRKAAGPGEVDVDRLIAGQRYDLLLKAQEQYLNQQRENVAGEIERRRAALVEANREVRVLEKLEERLLERHREKENKQEIKILDEMGNQRARRERIL